MRLRFTRSTKSVPARREQTGVGSFERGRRLKAAKEQLAKPSRVRAQLPHAIWKSRLAGPGQGKSSRRETHQGLGVRTLYAEAD